MGTTLAEQIEVVISKEKPIKLKFNKISELLALSFHHGYVDCGGFSQHYKITYGWLLTVNKCHLL